MWDGWYLILRCRLIPVGIQCRDCPGCDHGGDGDGTRALPEAIRRKTILTIVFSYEAASLLG